MSDFIKDLKNVKAFAFDVDGVFSLNTVFLFPDTEPIRSSNVKDGYALHYALKQGYPMGIISGGRSESVRQRFENLGMQHIYLGSTNKIEDFKKFYFKINVEPENILYMGDDIPDYEIMQRVGFPVCPADACDEIKAISKYVSTKNGGEGCVREILEMVLKAQGRWMKEGAFIW